MLYSPLYQTSEYYRPVAFAVMLQNVSTGESYRGKLRHQWWDFHVVKRGGGNILGDGQD